MGGSATLNDDVLVDSLVTDVIDGLRRDLHPQFGVRPYRVFLVRRTWSGAEVGEGESFDDERELDPQPCVERWDGYRWVLGVAGRDEKGEVRVREVSLTYTHDEVTGGALQANEEFLIKIGEAHGQGQPDRYFAHARPPFVDREKDMGWVLWLKDAAVPGCGG